MNTILFHMLFQPIVMNPRRLVTMDTVETQTEPTENPVGNPDETQTKPTGLFDKDGHE